MAIAPENGMCDKLLFGKSLNSEDGMDYDDLSKLARSFQYDLIGFDKLTDDMLSAVGSLLADANETEDQYLWIESQYNSTSELLLIHIAICTM